MIRSWSPPWEPRQPTHLRQDISFRSAPGIRKRFRRREPSSLVCCHCSRRSFLAFDEDGLQTNHIFAGRWNDVGVGTPLGYVVEYSASANSPVPEASTWAMLLLGFLGIGLTMRRRQSESTLRQIA